MGRRSMQIGCTGDDRLFMLDETGRTRQRGPPVIPFTSVSTEVTALT